MSSSEHDHHDVPRSRDGAPNWAADTDPVGPVTPELALVDPALASGETNREGTMSSMHIGDGTTFDAGEGAAAPAEPQPLPPLEPIPSLNQAAPAPAPEVAAPVPAEPASGVPLADMRDVPLGTLVFRAGLLPEERLEEALHEGMRTGRRLGEILLERGWVSDSDLGRLLAAQKGLPFVELDPAAIDATAPPLLHPEKARLHGALPIGFQDGVPVVAVADPSNDLVVENVRRALACEPHFVVAGRDALARMIEQAYGSSVAEGVAEAAPVTEPAVAEQPPAAAVEPAAGAVPSAEPAAPVTEPAAPMAEPSVPPVAEPAGPPAVEPAAAQPAPDAGLWLGGSVAEPLPQQPQPVGPVQPAEPAAPVTPPEPAIPAAAQPQHEVPSVEPSPPVAPSVSEPAPGAQPEAEPERAPEPSWTVVLRLADGERIEVGTYATEAEATEGARAVVAQIAADSGWPFFAGRFLRPDTIVSVDLVHQDADRWLGSSTRAAWARQHPSA